MFSPVNRDNWAVARRLGLMITTEFQGPNAAMLLDPMWQDRLVGPDNCFNHVGALPDRTWQIIRDAGVNINLCPRSDAQYALGEGFPPYQKALDLGHQARLQRGQRDVLLDRHVRVRCAPPS